MIFLWIKVYVEVSEVRSWYNFPPISSSGCVDHHYIAQLTILTKFLRNKCLKDHSQQTKNPTPQGFPEW